MDVGFFLHERVGFIRQLYETSAAAYIERKRLIEAGEPPFEPPYSEDGEPPFQVEWQEADDSLHVLGYACVSMLSDVMKVFFKTWQRQAGVPDDPGLKNVFKDKGFVQGYRALFEKSLGIRCADSGVDLALLEEVVIVRNSVQHQESLTMKRPSHSAAYLKRQTSPFFLDESEQSILASQSSNTGIWLMAPRVSVTGEQLLTVLAEMERFSKWMHKAMDELDRRRGARMRAREANAGASGQSETPAGGEGTR